MKPHALTAALLAAWLGLFTVEPAAASPPRGSVAPAINLNDLDGQAVSTGALAPRTLVLIFGELDHEGARQACATVLEVLGSPRLAASSAVPILIVGKNDPPGQLKDAAAKGRFPAIILHDPKRDAYGAYQVVVIPTVVVVDGNGKVVYCMPGFLPHAREILPASILAAEGKLTPEQFERAIDPKVQAPSHEVVRADRLSHLGAELARHGLFEMAEARYREALALAPGHVGASLGLGDLLTRCNRLDEAASLFRSVLDAHPDSQEAAMGIAAVQIKRGGDELAAAETALNSVIEKNPKQPLAHYLRGQVLELRADIGGAMVEYRRAAELMLER